VKPRNERGSSRKPGRRPERSRSPQRSTAPRGARDDKGLGGTQIEGRQAVRELLLAGRRRVHEILISEELDENPVMSDILELARDQRVPVRKIARRELEREARSEAPQGVIAFAQELSESDLADFVAGSSAKKKPFLIAVDGVTDPRNIGAIARSAAAFSADGLLIPERRNASLTAAAWKTSAGAAARLPIAQITNLSRSIEDAKAYGCFIVGLDGDADTTVDAMEIADQPLYVIVGSEGKGLSRLVREKCDLLISIPMSSAVESLNASVAMSIALYAIDRKRNVL